MPTGIYSHKKGIKHPGLNQKGKNNHRWRGGLKYDKDYQRNYHREYRIKVKEALLVMMGEKCVKCGFGDKRALQVDHINGGGTKERTEQKQSSTPYFRFIMKSVLANENKYQLLCANCNWIKRVENGEHGGRKYGIWYNERNNKQ